ncbi:MAG: M20/M25/M40 family metallo-hydrolase [Pseudomonadota bacterium]
MPSIQFSRTARKPAICALVTIAALLTNATHATTPVYATDADTAQSVNASIDHTARIKRQRDFILRFTIKDNEPMPRSTRRERAAAADTLASELAALGLDAERHGYRVPNSHPLLDLIAPPVQGVNIHATLPATTDSQSHIILGAHYDTVRDSPGANDNATGIAIVLEVIKTLSALESRQHHFVFVFFDQEEDGAPGSKAFAQKMLRDGVAVHSMHNADLIGWDGNGDQVVELELPTSELEALYRDSADHSGLTINPLVFNSSDHISFRELGFDAVCISEDWAGGDASPHYHKPTDRIEFVHFDYLAMATEMVATAMARLATTP